MRSSWCSRPTANARVKATKRHDCSLVAAPKSTSASRRRWAPPILFADRTSCHHWWANQFRLLLASLAYTLIETIRRVGIKGTELPRAYVGTIRLKLFKIAAVILINTRRVQFLLASTCPYQGLYFPGGATFGWRIDASRLVAVGVARSRHVKVRPIAGPNRRENNPIAQHRPIVSGKTNRCSASAAV